MASRFQQTEQSDEVRRLRARSELHSLSGGREIALPRNLNKRSSTWRPLIAILQGRDGRLISVETEKSQKLDEGVPRASD